MLDTEGDYYYYRRGVLSENPAVSENVSQVSQPQHAFPSTSQLSSAAEDQNTK